MSWVATYAETTMTLDLPAGFEDAPTAVQQEILENRASEDLVKEIADLVGEDEPRSGQLSKNHKAAVILALR